MLREQATRAAEQRAAAEMERERKAQEQLANLKKRWAEADKHTEAMRDQLFADAKARVQNWQGRKESAQSKYTIAVTADAKRIEDLFMKKEKRFEEWKVETEASRQEKARQVAASRSAAYNRFEGELQDRNERLEQAQELAAMRREAFAEAKRRELEERAELAERREQEAWEARLRVDREVKERIKQVELDCIRKKKQAETCLERRASETATRRLNNNTWRIPGAVPDRGLL